MFEGMDELDADGVLAAAEERRRTADRAEAELLGLAGHWADLHAVVDDETEEPARVPVRGTERLLPLAGEGTPEVAEFAPAELGATLGITSYAAAHLVGDALELRHRLPRLWARVHAGTVQPWRARRVADHTRHLSPAAAGWVDTQVAPVAHKIGVKRLTDLVAAAMWSFDPEAAAAAAEAARRAAPGVRVDGEGADGTCQLRINADPLAVAEFTAALTAIADALAGLGDPDPANLREAKAVGVIADPYAVLDLLTTTGQLPADGDTEHSDHSDHGGEPADTSRTDGGDGADGADGAESAGASALDRFHRRRRHRVAGGRPVLYIHLSADALAAHGGAAPARVEDAGLVAARQVMAWLGRTDLRIQPVIDLDHTRAVDSYETPTAIEETLVLRNPCCPFPWCNNLSRTGKDNDHITEYVPPDQGGPPGQTSTDNLARPCRRHHRLKTHGGWHYTMPEPGIYLWTSPHGRRYLVDHTGTTPLSNAA